MITINLHGSCVTRDSLELCKDKQIKILEYISRSSIFSIISRPLNLAVPDNNILGAWGRNCIKADFDKSIFDRFRTNKSDFLLIDLIDERFGLLECCSALSEKTFVTDSSILRESGLYNDLAAAYECTKINPLTFSEDVIENTIKSYSDSIKSIYTTDRIIINECYAVYHYISNEGNICDFDDDKRILAQNINKKLARYYPILESELDGCNIIKMPLDIYALEKNKWGLAPYHFEDRYYSIFMDRLFKIMKI
jgi:hypothetical protein